LEINVIFTNFGFRRALGVLVAGLSGCVTVTPTVQNDDSLRYVELNGYRFHVRTFGDPQLPPLIVVHGGPGGDAKYLYSLQELGKTNYLVLYDQRGTPKFDS
jgi:proline iminopeptidase